jgi:MATE family multidrug resistance protein
MLFFWYIKNILIFFGQSPPIADIVQTFFHTFMWGVIPGNLCAANRQFAYGIHQKHLVTAFTLMSSIIQLVSAYVLIFGKWGFPALGVAGLGYATVAQYMFFFIFSTLYFYCVKKFDKYELFRYRVHQHLDHFTEMFQLGWPITIQVGGEVLSLFVTGLMIGWLGTQALAAYQIVNQYYFLALIPLFSLSQASTILISHAKGEKRFHDIKLLGYAGIIIALLATLSVAALFTFIPQHLAAVYINIHNPENAEVLRIARFIFLILGLTLIFDGVRNTFIGATRGLFDTKYPMYMGLLAIWLLGVPLSYLLGFIFHLGVVGIMLGTLFGITVGSLIMLYRWHIISNKY